VACGPVRHIGRDVDELERQPRVGAVSAVASITACARTNSSNSGSVLSSPMRAAQARVACAVDKCPFPCRASHDRRTIRGMAAANATVVLGASGEIWPAFGLGTWRLGERRSAADEEVALLREAVEIGYRVFDTAEMYGEGGAETVLGRALNEAMRSQAVRREQLHVVSKAYPHHADVAGLRKACDASRRRLHVDTIDLYLLHWRGSTPLAETLEGFHRLQATGAIRHWGVSNFDLADMQELSRLKGGGACAANQVYHAPSERGVELDLLPWQRERRIALMAYSPIDGGRLASDTGLKKLAASYGTSAAQLALAWLLRLPQVMVIPKAGRKAHLVDNWNSQQLELPEAAWQALEALFPKPARKRPLAMR
jgi:diketogulonate reductase-like aldo/keto reductase